MGKDIRIYPSQSQIFFSGSNNEILASITTDNLGNLILSASNDVLFGPGKNDIYIGDGIQSANIIYDVDGAIKSAPGSGATITLGSTDTPVVITGSTIDISGGNLELGTFTSSYAKISNASLTGSLSASYVFTSLLSASSINVNDILVNNITASTLTLLQNQGLYFNYSSSVTGAAIFLDNLGNLVLNSTSGSVYLAKDQNDIYIGDGTSSADIVYDVDGAIRGENGKNVKVTLGSNQTQVNITGSNIFISAYTASNALIQGGNITASAITASGTINANILSVSSSITSNTLNSTSASISFITASTINVNNAGGIFLTGSSSTTGASIKLDTFGNLILNAISGNVFFGKNSNDIYLGDGSSSANLIYDFDGTLKGTPGTTLTVGSSSANLLFTGSNITFQPQGGNINFSGNLIVTNSSGSRISTTSSGIPSFTGADGQFIFGSSGGNHFIYVWMSGAWRSSSLS